MTERYKSNMTAPNNQSQSPKPRKLTRLENGVLDVTSPQGQCLKMFEDNARNSPLLSLPAEIRNRIWEYAAGGRRALDYYGEPTTCTWEEEMDEEENRYLRMVPAIETFAVCRQMYTETALLCYRVNEWSFGGDVGLERWLKCLYPCERDQIEAIEMGSQDLHWDGPWFIDNPNKKGDYVRRLKDHAEKWTFAQLPNLKWLRFDICELTWERSGGVPKMSESDVKAEMWEVLRLLEEMNPGVKVLIEVPTMRESELSDENITEFVHGGSYDHKVWE